MTTPIYQFDFDGLPMLDDLSHDEIKHGFKLFFINQPNAAEAFFKSNVDVPLFAMGYAAVRWLWSLLTLDPKDLEIGMAAAKRAEEIAQAQLKHYSSSSWFGSSRPTEDNLNPEHVFYDVMETEAMLLGAIMQIVNGSVLGKLRAGLTIRTVWQRYSRIEKLCAISEGQQDMLHMETRAAIEFGVGVFNLVCSILPPKILAVAKVLGFPSSRAAGLRNLKVAFDRGSVVSPLAGLALLFHNTILQKTYDLGTECYREAAEDILRIAKTDYPNSGWFYMFEGRYARLLRETTRSLDAFYLARERQSEWRPLVDVCNYEIAFSAMMQYDYVTALDHWLRLQRENDWSKAFYSYMAAACMQKLGQTADAQRTFVSIADMPVLKLHNGRIPVDIFVTRRIDQRVTETQTDLPLAHLEILFVWAGFYHMSRQCLEMAWQEVVQAEKEFGPQPKPYNKSLLLLLRGALCAQLGMYDQACQYFDELESMKKLLKEEVWHVFYGRYEHAILLYKQDGEATTRVKDMLNKAQSSKDHNWDTRLHLRIGTARYHMAHASELGLSRPEVGIAQSLLKAPEPASDATTHVTLDRTSPCSQDGSVDLDVYLAPPEPPKSSCL
eukprot:m.172612 g.172612  ORF g.172612 m.172612 type:complete len:609 (+) comp16723_c0_seq1:114-1940(+)